MNTNKIEALRAIARLYGSELTDYSGRGMYGKTCAAISTTSPACVIESAQEADILGAHTDSLGKGHIVYWPGVAYDGEEPT